MRLVLAGSGNGNNSFGHKVYRGIHIERDEWEDHKQADTRSTDAIGKRKSRVDFSFFNGVGLKEFGTEGMGWIDGWMHLRGKKRDGNGFWAGDRKNTPPLEMEYHQLGLVLVCLSILSSWWTLWCRVPRLPSVDDILPVTLVLPESIPIIMLGRAVACKM